MISLIFILKAVIPTFLLMSVIPSVKLLQQVRNTKRVSKDTIEMNEQLNPDFTSITNI